MSQTPRLPPPLSAVIAALVLLGSGTAGFDERAHLGRDVLLPSFAKLKPGMSPEQVQQIVGVPPKHIARQILYHRYREQWVYGTSSPVRLNFDCPRGQTPQLLSVSGLPH